MPERCCSRAQGTANPEEQQTDKGEKAFSAFLRLFYQTASEIAQRDFLGKEEYVSSETKRGWEF